MLQHQRWKDVPNINEARAMSNEGAPENHHRAGACDRRRNQAANLWLQSISASQPTCTDLLLPASQATQSPDRSTACAAATRSATSASACLD